MAVPNTMADLAQLAGSNSPAGSEAISNNLDNYLRGLSAIIRSTAALSSASIAAASTTDLSTSDAESVIVTGSATINSFGTGFNGCVREVRFTGVCTIVAGVNIGLPNVTNITTANGDVLVFRCTGTGGWTLAAASRPLFSSLGGKPTTLAGYGITDGQTALGYTPVNKAGDTGIGALSCTGTLTVAKNSGALFDGYTSDLSKRFAWGNSYSAFDDGIAWITNFANTDMVFSTNGTERGRIKNTGVLSWGAAGLQLNGGQTITKVTLANTTPGTLASGELYLQY